jgi:hypothetical protein
MTILSLSESCNRGNSIGELTLFMAVELLAVGGTTQTLSLAKRIMTKNNRIKIMKSSEHDSKSGLQPILQPNAAFIEPKSGADQSKEADSTSK